MGMAFLFLSVTITPLSLRSLGISPSLTAGIDAWRQISSVFGDSHQPVTSSELLALNNPNSDDATSVDSSNGIEQSLIAELQAEIPQSYVLQLGGSELQFQARETVNRQKRCPKAARTVRRIETHTVEIASFINPEITQTAAKPVVVINRSDWKNFEKHISQYRFDIGEAMKLLPMKDLKVKFKLKDLALPVAPVAPKCNSRKAVSPEQAKQLQQRAMRERAADQLPTAPENCEL
jgi:hypothetical protein